MDGKNRVKKHIIRFFTLKNAPLGCVFGRWKEIVFIYKGCDQRRLIYNINIRVLISASYC